MKLVACILVTFVARSLAFAPDHQAKWESFKAKHAKQHPAHEDAERMQRFLQRDAEIEEHNARYAAGLESYSLGHNRFSDLSDAEIGQKAFGLLPDEADEMGVDSAVPELSAKQGKLPAAFDWRDRGAQSPAKDQEDCGACYAFAAAAQMEAVLRLQRNVSVDLSEQSIIDCTYVKYMKRTLNRGCFGGTVNVVYMFVNETGIAEGADYQYTSGVTELPGKCRPFRSVPNIAGKVVMTRLRDLSEDDMARVLVEKGPLVVGIAADGEYKPHFSKLRDGIFDLDGSADYNPNHAVLLVGYGEDHGKPYWVIKNSWGADWGVGGYGKIARGKNMCNILKLGVWVLELLD